MNIRVVGITLYFFMLIPTVWDENVVLDVSEIGDMVAIAR